MNIEKWIIAHFSSTGGTRKVADAIAAGLGIPVIEMELTGVDSDPAVMNQEHTLLKKRLFFTAQPLGSAVFVFPTNVFA